MTPARQRTDLLRTHLKAFTRLLHKVEGGDVRAIHRARVASRRLRELVPVLQLESATCARLLRDLRRATRALGRVRELDVTAQLVADLEAQATGISAAVLARVSSQLRAVREVAHARGVHKGRLSTGLRRVAKRLERVTAGLERRGDRHHQRWRWALDARIVRRAEALNAAIRSAGPFYVPERLHAVRIAMKKLRYSLELGSAVRNIAYPELSLLRRGQELLGTLHDRQRLIEHFRETQATLPPGDRRLSRHLDTLIASAEDECRVLHARYVRQREGMREACARLAPAAPPAPPSRRRLPATRLKVAR